MRSSRKLKLGFVLSVLFFVSLGFVVLERDRFVASRDSGSPVSGIMDMLFPFMRSEKESKESSWW